MTNFWKETLALGTFIAGLILLCTVDDSKNKSTNIKKEIESPRKKDEPITIFEWDRKETCTYNEAIDAIDDMRVPDRTKEELKKMLFCLDCDHNDEFYLYLADIIHSPLYKNDIDDNALLNRVVYEIEFFGHRNMPKKYHTYGKKIEYSDFTSVLFNEDTCISSFHKYNIFKDVPGDLSSETYKKMIEILKSNMSDFYISASISDLLAKEKSNNANK